MIYVLIAVIALYFLTNYLVEDKYVGAFETSAKKFLLSLYTAVIAIMSIIIIAIVIVIIVTVGKPEQIALLEQENQIIEERIESLVNDYIEYESDTYSEILTNTNSVEIILLIPALSSSVIIQKQLDIYYTNHAAIVELKQDQIDHRIAFKILFFI